jgi:hypothetical protein
MDIQIADQIIADYYHKGYQFADAVINRMSNAIPVMYFLCRKDRYFPDCFKDKCKWVTDDPKLRIIRLHIPDKYDGKDSKLFFRRVRGNTAIGAVIDLDVNFTDISPELAGALNVTFSTVLYHNILPYPYCRMMHVMDMANVNFEQLSLL